MSTLADARIAADILIAHLSGGGEHSLAPMSPETANKCANNIATAYKVIHSAVRASISDHQDFAAPILVEGERD